MYAYNRGLNIIPPNDHNEEGIVQVGLSLEARNGRSDERNITLTRAQVEAIAKHYNGLGEARKKADQKKVLDKAKEVWQDAYWAQMYGASAKDVDKLLKQGEKVLRDKDFDSQQVQEALENYKEEFEQDIKRRAKQKIEDRLTLADLLEKNELEQAIEKAKLSGHIDPDDEDDGE